MIGYTFGASFVALFAQLGGGIYTKVSCCLLYKLVYVDRVCHQTGR
jgi:Na+/H+-translocating membrane pyrophosphatase